MLSSIPIDLKKVKKEDINKEILRVGMIAELDAVSLYEQLASITTDEDIRKILLDIAKEEKTHMGEFQALLLREDKEQSEEMTNAWNEVREKTGK
ncbi:MAG: ferritin family protein [archaeon]|nr:ferritin family protein [archaeon]